MKSIAYWRSLIPLAGALVVGGCEDRSNLAPRHAPQTPAPANIEQINRGLATQLHTTNQTTSTLQVPKTDIYPDESVKVLQRVSDGQGGFKLQAPAEAKPTTTGGMSIKFHTGERTLSKQAQIELQGKALIKPLQQDTPEVIYPNFEPEGLSKASNTVELVIMANADHLTSEVDTKLIKRFKLLLQKAQDDKFKPEEVQAKTISLLGNQVKCLVFGKFSVNEKDRNWWRAAARANFGDNATTQTPAELEEFIQKHSR